MASARSDSVSALTLKLMKPGPARLTSASRMSPASRSATASVAIARGLRPADFAAARAPLHWKSARSGRSEGVTRPKLADKPAPAKAAPTASPRPVLRSVIACRRRLAWAVVTPALARKRSPSRLNCAICGVTSKPTSTSKLAPLTLTSARGMVIPVTSSIFCTRSWPAGKSTGRSKYSLSMTPRLRSVTATQ